MVLKSSIALLQSIAFYWEHEENRIFYVYLRALSLRT
jgi:hypothetical protein